MIGKRLKLARAAAGFSLRDLSAAMDGLVTAQAIGKYERNEAQPGSQVLIALSKALDVPVDYLVGDDGLTLEAVDFRKKSITSAKEEAQVAAQALHLLERYLMVEELLGLSSSNWSMPEGAPYLARDLVDAESAALHLREAWGLGLDPIPNLVELLEEQGIKILGVRLANVDGLMARVGRAGKTSVPVIVLNNQVWGERQRFTLAHELGHLMLDVSNGLDEESAAQRFASGLLMPTDSLCAEVGKHRTSIGWAELFELKKLFGVSVQAVVYRCQELGIFPKKLAQSLWREISKQGWRKPPYEEPHSLPVEHPTRFFRLCFRALAEGAISEAKAAELLGLRVQQLNQLMDDPQASDMLKHWES